MPEHWTGGLMPTIVGDFTLDVDLAQIGGGAENGATISIRRRATDHQAIIDPVNDTILMPHPSGKLPWAISSNWSTTLETDVETDVSEAIAYDVTVKSRAGSVKGEFYAPADGATINLADYIGEAVTLPLPEVQVLRNEAVAAAAAAASSAATVNPSNFVAVQNPVKYGAVGDGVADDTAALQDAIDAAAAAGGAVYIPPGTFKVTSPLVITDRIRMYGADRKNCVIRSATSDVLHISKAHHDIENIGFWSLAGGGHVVAVQPGAAAGTALSQARFAMVEFNQANDGKSVWHFDDTAGLGGGFFDVHWIDCLFQHTLTATVPGFYGYSTDGNFFSRNRFTRCRAHSSGTFFFDIQLDAASSFNYGNTWDDINFEVCNGGGIRMLSALGNRILGPGFHDNGTITEDLIYFGRLATRNQSRDNHVQDYYRTAGTLSGGAVDILFGSGENAGTNVLTNVGGTVAAGVTVDCGSSAGYVVVAGYDQATVTINNVNSARTVLLAAENGLTVPKLTVAGIQYLTGTTNPEGSVTATAGAVYIRTGGSNVPRLYVKMSGTGNTGWAPASAPLTRTTTQLTAASDTINTEGKTLGRMVYNTTTKKPVWADGTAATSVWVDATGTTAHTPA